MPKAYERELERCRRHTGIHAAWHLNAWKRCCSREIQSLWRHFRRSSTSWARVDGEQINMKKTTRFRGAFTLKLFSLVPSIRTSINLPSSHQSPTPPARVPSRAKSTRRESQYDENNTNSCCITLKFVLNREKEHRHWRQLSSSHWRCPCKFQLPCHPLRRSPTSQARVSSRPKSTWTCQTELERFQHAGIHAAIHKLLLLTSAYALEPLFDIVADTHNNVTGSGLPESGVYRQYNTKLWNALINITAYQRNNDQLRHSELPLTQRGLTTQVGPPKPKFPENITFFYHQHGQIRSGSFEISTPTRPSTSSGNSSEIQWTLKLSKKCFEKTTYFMITTNMAKSGSTVWEVLKYPPEKGQPPKWEEIWHSMNVKIK